jgi:DNA modification methylase
MTGRNFLDGKVTLLCGDSSELIKGLPENSIDAVVCDPPYALVSIVKRFGGANAAPAKGNEAYQRASAGFMGKTWDTGEVAFSEAFWADVLRVLKPGGHLVAFSGTRTYHQLASAIELAGFEIRDMLSWNFGSGFPKSHDVSKGIDKKLGAEREKVKVRHSSQSLMTKDGQNERPWQEAAKVNGFHELAGPEPVTNEAKAWAGWGTALKPAHEPICLARKPLTGTVAANVLEHGVGALNIDGCRVVPDEPRPARVKIGGASNGIYGDGLNNSRAVDDTMLGRWPANLIHDGSEEVVGAFPDSACPAPHIRASDTKNGIYGSGMGEGRDGQMKGNFGDSGSAARFFYTAKADADDRLGSKHPTVKPVDLMQWLCRLVCPKGGTVLDPFAGTGTTGEAAWREGMRAILMEREPEYQEDISRRMELAVQPTKRAAVAASKNNLERAEDLPLFALLAE